MILLRFVSWLLIIITDCETFTLRHQQSLVLLKHIIRWVTNIRGDLKKAKVHYEAAAMAGHELALSTLVGTNELHSGNTTRAIKIGQLAAC